MKTLLVFLLLATPAFAQSPCVESTALVTSPTTLYVTSPAPIAVVLTVTVQGSQTPVAAPLQITQAALAMVALDCYAAPVPSLATLPKGVVYIATGRFADGTTAVSNPFTFPAPPPPPPPPPPVTCPLRSGEITRDGVRLVKITTTVAKLPALLLELRAQGWEYVLTGTATVYATTTCSR